MRWLRSSRGHRPRRRPSTRWRWHRRITLHWWLHAIGWLLLAVPFGLAVIWWAAPLGVVAFELLLAALVVRRVPVGAGGGRWPRGPGDDGSAGVREPRRPLPTSGAGAASLPG